MPQRYKLRLGDGTVLAVDSEGLNTWSHDRRAMAQAIGTQQWRPLQDVMAEEAAAARLAAALVPPKPRQSTPAQQPPPEPSPIAPEPAAPAAAPPFEAPFEPASLMPPAEPSGPAFELPELPPPAPAAPSPSSFAPQEFDLPSASGPQQPLTQSFADDPPPQAFVEEPVSQRYFEAAAEPTPRDDEIAVIPMKPLDEREERGYREEREEFRSAWTEDGATADDDEARQDAREGFDDQTLTVLERVGGFLSRVLSPLAPAADRLTARRQKSDVAEQSYEPAEEEDVEEDEDDDDREPAGPSLSERLSAWVAGLREGLSGLLARLSGLFERFRRPSQEESRDEEEEEEDEAEEERDEPYDFAPPPQRAPARASAPPPRPIVPEKVHVPPKPATELPVVPFKQLPPEPRRREDVYDDDSGFSLSFLNPLWQWLKFLATTGALVAAVWYAWVERAKWLPRAADLGQSMFSELDRQVLSRTRHQERQKALGDASRELPHLSPETIQLVFARNPMGVEEPAEVFQIAREAAERGAKALPAAEAEELEALEGELLNGLSRIERERVREYDETRTRREVFSFENPRVMELVAQGARLLPADRRARLQALLHKAVSAGLEPPPAGTPTGSGP